MSGDEVHARTVKWEKHKSIQRMDTALPNTFRRDLHFDKLVKNTTGYDVDQQPASLQSRGRQIHTLKGMVSRRNHKHRF